MMCTQECRTRGCAKHRKVICRHAYSPLHKQENGECSIISRLEISCRSDAHRAGELVNPLPSPIMLLIHQNHLLFLQYHTARLNLLHRSPKTVFETLPRGSLHMSLDMLKYFLSVCEVGSDSLTVRRLDMAKDIGLNFADYNAMSSAFSSSASVVGFAAGPFRPN